MMRRYYFYDPSLEARPCCRRPGSVFIPAIGGGINLTDVNTRQAEGRETDAGGGDRSTRYPEQYVQPSPLPGPGSPPSSAGAVQGKCISGVSGIPRVYGRTHVSLGPNTIPH
jgi:hypothetical protein